MMVMKFRTGIRVVVLTANFVEMDVGEKSQGVWYQEFPLRPSSDTCDFEVFFCVVCLAMPGAFGSSVDGKEAGNGLCLVLIMYVP